MIIAAAAFASCKKTIYVEPDLKNIPNINMISGEAYVIYDVFKIKIKVGTKAGWNPYDLPKSYDVQCIDKCSYTVNGKFYDQSEKFFINE